jgi:hypothetical protein
MIDAEREKLERDLRTLIPVAVALAARESWPREVLVNKLIQVVMTCVTEGVPREHGAELTGKPAHEDLLGATWSAEPLTHDEITRARAVGIDVGDNTDQRFPAKWALIRQDTARREAERAPEESPLTMHDLRERYDC